MSTVRRSRALAGAGPALLLAVALAGCASLPASGPTARQVLRAAQPGNQLGLAVLDVSPAVVAQANGDVGAADARVATLSTLAAGGRNDTVGPGDVLAISVYEVGVGLFGAQRTTAADLDVSARGETFPAVTVDTDGNVKLPYTGEIHVAGRTPAEIQVMVERAYRGKSQTPQALVVVRQNISKTVYVTGDVRRPGRIELTLAGERLLDAVANAGGTVSQTQDMVVRVTRGGRSVEERLDRIRAGAPDDLALVAGDRIELIREPQTFVVFGAALKIAQVPFEQTELTLAEAVARAGGPSDAAADPKAVFLFRYDPPRSPGAQARPVIYRLNMMDPAQYFLAQRFAMRDKDVLYVSNARINRTAKFVGILNQLFSPFVTARAVTGN